MSFSSPARGASCAALLLGAAVLPPLAAQSTFERALETYEKYRNAASFGRRTNGRNTLAQSGDPRALDLLIRDYARPEQPEEFVRATITNLAQRTFQRGIPPQTWAAWRDAHEDTEHSELWYTALAAEAAQRATSWRSIAVEHDDVVLRAVALLAGGEATLGNPIPAEMDTFEAVYDGLPRRGVKRDVLTTAIARSLAPNAGGQHLAVRPRALLRKLADELEERSVSDHCKRTLSRYFAAATGRADVGPVYEAWSAVLGEEVGHEQELLFGRFQASYRQAFFGIPTNGERVVYVLDASDSMLEPLTPRELADLAPTTGGSNDKGRRAERGASLQAEQAIDWSQVKTRFDCAKALLRLALGKLDSKTRFGVVLFGGEIRVLTPSLVRASKGQIAKTLGEIDAIEIGPVKQDRPHGTLMGNTNIHGGMLAAFSLTDSRPIDSYPNTSLTGFEKGCDTIYLLSDGAPSEDNWTEPDENLDGIVGDAETGETKKWDGNILVFGPFANGFHLEPDIRRLNRIRHAVIHTISLGEAERGLMERIAEQHGGKSLQLGG